MKKETRGGKRPNSGRKKLWDEPTERINITIPTSNAVEIKAAIKKLLSKYRK